MRHLVLAVAALACSASASAEIITFEYTGIVNYIRETSNGNSNASRGVVKSDVVPGTIAIGDTFHGKFSYDTETPAFSVEPERIFYAPEWNAPGNSASLVLDKSGAAINGFGGTYVSVTNGASDFLSFGPGSQFNPYANFNFWFYDPAGGAIDSLAIPTNVNFNDWYSSDITISWNNDVLNKSISVEAMVTSFTRVSPVPEPSTYAMLFAGLALVGAAARKRKLQG